MPTPYQPCQCGADCFRKDENPAEPCYGEVHGTEDYPGEYAHACTGHWPALDGDPYKPGPAT